MWGMGQPMARQGALGWLSGLCSLDWLLYSKHSLVISRKINKVLREQCLPGLFNLVYVQCRRWGPLSSLTAVIWPLLTDKN